MGQVGALGEVVFEVSADMVRTWESLKRDGEARWAEHEVLDLKQRLQFVGLDLETVDLSIKLVAPWCEPLNELKKLRELRDSGKHHKLVIGQSLFGNYVVKRLSEDWTRTDGGGAPLVIACSLQLQEYN